MSVWSTWSKVWFQSNVSLGIFCLDDVSLADGGVRKSTTITVSLPWDLLILLC